MNKDRHVTRTGDDYAEAFSSLLPWGLAWPRGRDSVLMHVVSGLAQVWGTVDAQAASLLELESDPRTALILLPDWERNFGLPDECYAEPFTIGDRQRALVQRMTIEGGQSREFFISAAAYIGYPITISEYRPFMVGIDRVGDNRTLVDGVYGDYPYVLGPPENRFYWTVHVSGVRLTWFRVGGGGGQTGVDPHLRIALATDLECLLNRWRPAHTQIIFDYSGVELPPTPEIPPPDNHVIQASSHGALVLSSPSPTVSVVPTTGYREPPSGNLALSPSVPMVIRPPTVISPQFRNLVFSRFSPTVTVGAPNNIQPSSGNLALSRFAPTIAEIQPSSRNLVLSTFAPTRTP